ncbi:toxin-antitoxin system HicB family antitoxin [Paenibacillus curdlanolyticus]|uniref:toxin-antitoxin system HicB family antitoxin n=1 Tax=Paenibacillus curdlanolyticus TaxID=59840 RepID=UPI001F42CD07|nr:toxin-antitoxin system HicB family antitoxin [Paenibacillus curdlanolyticus]
MDVNQPATQSRHYLDGLKEALAGWIAVKLDHANPIPEPNEGYNGKILLPLPKSLHQQLAVKADLEGVSLNQYLVFKLSN